MNSPEKETLIGKVVHFVEHIKTSDSFWAGLARDLVFVVGMVLLFMLVSQIALGTPRPAVAVESGSMIPNINIGDVVIIQSYDRVDIITYVDGAQSGYTSFNKPGNVILYRKYGSTTDTPIIHRAMYWVDEGTPMWEEGPLAPHSGYITKGDNNREVDQVTSTSRLQPVKKEWIIGVARWRIPWIGHLSLAVHG